MTLTVGWANYRHDNRACTYTVFPKKTWPYFRW